MSNSKLSESLKKYWASGEAAARRAKDKATDVVKSAATAAGSIKRQETVRARNMGAGLKASIGESSRKASDAVKNASEGVQKRVKKAKKTLEDKVSSHSMKTTGNSFSGKDIRARK
jgi:hypothetical protein